MMDNARNRLAFHHPGALAALTYDDLPTNLLAAANVLLVTGYTILPQLRPHGFAQAWRPISGWVITAVDIGPAIGTVAQLAELTPLLPHIDYLIANRHELAVCTGVEDVEQGATRLLKAGARCVIVKLGKAGAAIWTAGMHTHAPGALGGNSFDRGGRAIPLTLACSMVCSMAGPPKPLYVLAMPPPH